MVIQIKLMYQMIIRQMAGKNYLKEDMMLTIQGYFIEYLRS